MAEPAPVVYGKYQLLELLARGGMAEVFKAKSHGVEGFEKILVIKRILPELSVNPQFVEMFINEAKIAVTLSHANIVQVFDLGRADDSYFIAMEYVAGFDLATILALAKKHDKPLPPELAVYIVSEVAKGLDYAHRRRDGNMRPLNIVHRDVSPQNVLLSYEGEVKLTDFGIAKARTTVEHEEEGVLKGKYAYMAPEQANSREVDARADLFALGTVLYEALSGDNPFQRDSAYDTLKLVRAGDAKPVREVAPDLPEELSQIVALAMSPRPEERHPNAGRLYEELIQFLYSSGRRVGAHDLSRFLDEIQEASERARARKPHDSVDLAAAFEEEGIVYEGTDATPAESPHVKPGSRPRRVSTQMMVPTAERRDVTAVAIHSSHNDPTPDSTVHSLIRRFGGTVVRQSTTHDGRWLLVLFGAVDPDGLDSVAAARCALRITRVAAAAAEEAAESTLRAAVHTGRVHVDLDGKILEDTTLAEILDAVRSIARSARRGSVVVTPGAARAIRTFFNLTPVADDPRAAQVITSERSTAESQGKFVGRRNELRRVGEILAFANKGRRRILGVVGEAGAGKSRLLSETLRRLRLGGHDVGMYLAQVSRKNRDVPFSAMQEMLRVVLGIDELDPEPIIRDKVARLRELGLTAAEIEAVEITLGLASDKSGRTKDRPLRSAIARVATRLAEDRLTVFGFDGVDAMDDESQALLNALLRDARDARLAIVLAYRPGFVHPWGDLPGYHEVEVGPLTDEDVVRLTGSRLGADEVPMDLLRDVTAKSGGNPLYLEEYLKALEDARAVEVDHGKVIYRPEVAEVGVPKTLRGIVAARVARLGTVERQILSIAAVVGPRFSPDVLAKVAAVDAATVARALSVLELRGIVTRQASGEYAFAHDLVGEVLRDGLTIEGGKQLHGAVASTLEYLYPQRVDEIAERLAEHWRLSGDRSKAVDYLVRACDRLENEQALDGAVMNLGRAIDMLAQMQVADRDRVLALYRRLGELSFRSRDLDEGAAKMAKALELAEDLGRDEYVARFAMMRGRLLVNSNRFEEGQKWLERAREVGRQLGNRELLRDITLATAEGASKNGLYASAAVLLEEALGLSRDTGDLQAQIRCLLPLSLAVAATSDGARALEHLEEARRLAGIHPDRYTECELLKTEALIHYYLRNHQGTVAASARALELAKEYGFWYEAAVNSHNLGEGYLRLDDYKRAFASLRYSYELAKEHGLSRVEYMNLRVLGFIDAVRFGSLEGRRRIQEAADYAQTQGFHWDYVQSLHLLGIADSALGDIESSRKAFRECLRLASEQNDSRYREDAEAALRALDAGEPVPLPH